MQCLPSCSRRGASGDNAGSEVADSRRVYGNKEDVGNDHEKVKNDDHQEGADSALVNDPRAGHAEEDGGGLRKAVGQSALCMIQRNPDSQKG